MRTNLYENQNDAETSQGSGHEYLRGSLRRATQNAAGEGKTHSRRSIRTARSRCGICLEVGSSTRFSTRCSLSENCRNLQSQAYQRLTAQRIIITKIVIPPSCNYYENRNNVPRNAHTFLGTSQSDLRFRRHFSPSITPCGTWRRCFLTY